MSTSRPVIPQTHLQVEKIAALTDFSHNSENGVRFAAAAARIYKSSIILAHAYVPMPCAFSAPEARMVLQSLDTERRNLTAHLIEEEEAPFLHGITCSVLLVEGTPKDLLKRLTDVDLIVVGTSGVRGLEKAAIGSTAETIFRSSLVPVLTVGPRCDCNVAIERALKTILYATDFSPEAALALPYALSIAQKAGAKLILLHAAPGKKMFLPSGHPGTSDRLLEVLHSLACDGTGLKDFPTCVVGFGKPDALIIETAKDLRADLIVMGARGAGRLASVVSHLGGRTAYRVAANAECPVLTIPGI